MRISVILLAVVVGGLLLMKPVFNISPTALLAVADVAAGLGAKVACSHRYITRLSGGQIAADLASYSSAYGLVDLDFDEPSRRVEAHLFGFGGRAARYREGLGCTLDIGDTTALDELRVAGSVASATAWPEGSVVETIDYDRQAALDEMLARDREGGFQSRALLWVSGGRLVAESYGEGFGVDTAHLGWSMGKSVTAMLLGSMELRGQVSPLDRGLFPQWDGDERAAISLEDLLQMVSGLAFGEVYAPGSDATRMLFTEHSAASVPLESPLVHEPGEYFSYSSGTTNLLSKLFVQRAGGTQAALDYLLREFFIPLGVAHTTMELDPSGVFVGSSYIYGSARDWGRLGQLMLNGGELNGTRFFSEDWVRRATTPGRALNEARYGYQFWLNRGGHTLRWPDLPEDAYAMMGNRGQVVMIVPSRGTVIVRLGWSAREYPVSERFAGLLELPQG